MRLTKKKAIELCIELWKWCARTGKSKVDWPGWKKYDHALNHCWFCEYSKMGCGTCPLVLQLGLNCSETFYDKWDNAKTPRTRKKYAKLFLEQIKKC